MYTVQGINRFSYLCTTSEKIEIIKSKILRIVLQKQLKNSNFYAFIQIEKLQLTADTKYTHTQKSNNDLHMLRNIHTN